MKYARILALCTAVSLSLTACGSRDAGKTPSPGAEASTGISVRTATVVREEMSTESTVSGKVEAEDEAVVMIGATAKCTRTYVNTGDEVKKGDVLCTLDLGSTLSQYNAARIGYDSAMQSYNDQKGLFDQQLGMAEKNVAMSDKQIAMLEEQIVLTNRQIELMGPQIELAKKNVDDTKALAAIGAASQMECDNAQIQYDNLQFQLDQAKFQVEQAGFQMEQLKLQKDNAQVQVEQLKATRTSTLAQLEAGIQTARSGVQQLDNVLEDVDANGNVIAPMNGTLVTFNATDNNYISNAMPLAVIQGESRMKVTVSVSEALVPKIVSGDEAEVYVSAVEKRLLGTVRSVDRSANPQTRLYAVTLDLPDSDGLLSGMFADVTFHVDRIADTVVIPSQAILSSNGTDFVYIVEGNTAKYVEVVTGGTGTGVTQILSGLTGGEQLVTVGQSYLSDGAAVRVVAEE